MSMDNDRIGKFLIPKTEDFIFDELSDAYLERAGLTEVMKDVPVPIRRTELGDLSTLAIARNMAFVLGCDPEFAYRENYMAYIFKTFGGRFGEALIGDGVDAANRGDYLYACIQFRAAIQLSPESADAYYCYGRACKDVYEAGGAAGEAEAGESDESDESAEAYASGEGAALAAAAQRGGEDFIGRFKAEALDAFETATIKNPKHAEALYFLGYGYLNMGLYIKAKLTWEDFLKLCGDEELRRDVEDRLEALEEPVKIEQGYNLILAQKYEAGIETLLPYKEGSFAGWWPLWYYLGVGYGALGQTEEAIVHFREALRFSPSNADVMRELAEAYKAIGDTAMAEKYEKKIDVVKRNAETDMEEKRRYADVDASGRGILN